jgi:hypothetical protein
MSFNSFYVRYIFNTAKPKVTVILSVISFFSFTFISAPILMLFVSYMPVLIYIILWLIFQCSDFLTKIHADKFSVSLVPFINIGALSAFHIAFQYSVRL